MHVQSVMERSNDVSFASRSSRSSASPQLSTIKFHSKNDCKVVLGAALSAPMSELSMPNRVSGSLEKDNYSRGSG